MFITEIICNDSAVMSAHPFACDVFSYAILAWQVLSGSRPYQETKVRSVHELLRGVVNGLRPKLQPLGEGGGVGHSPSSSDGTTSVPASTSEGLLLPRVVPAYKSAGYETFAKHSVAFRSFDAVVQQQLVAKAGAQRVDMGKHVAGAQCAVISAPGAVPRSLRVMLTKVPFKNQKGKLVLLGGTDIVPMLERGNTYKVCLDLDQRVVDVQGGDIHFHGVSAYEYWNTVVDTANRVIASSKGGGKTIEARQIAHMTEYSFACVWVPGVEGCCGKMQAPEGVSAQAWQQIATKYEAKYSDAAKLVHEKLIAGYSRARPTPDPTPCDNCHWFDFWAANVVRCHEAGQKLRFSYLDEPLYAQQPQFRCTAVGHEGLYYVGIAQKIELEWAQDQMCLVVTPIKIDEVMESVERQTGYSITQAIMGSIASLPGQGAVEPNGHMHQYHECHICGLSGFEIAGLSAHHEEFHLNSPLPMNLQRWPKGVREMLMASWANKPADRPGFGEVLRLLQKQEAAWSFL